MKCTALTGACNCSPCRLAAADLESPLALPPGRWAVGRHGIRVRVAA